MSRIFDRAKDLAVVGALCSSVGLAAAPVAQALGVEPNGKVSSAPFNVATNGTTYGAGMTGDGRFVVYASEASNIAQGDTNGAYDVFRFDRLTTVTTPISLGPWLSFVPGESKLSNNSNSITPDGRYVLFYSRAALVAGDTNNQHDVFVRDVNGLGSTRRVSVSNTGGQLNGFSMPIGITGDARYAFFMTDAAVDAGDTNAEMDIYRRDLWANLTTRITPSPAGGVMNGSISRDGRFLVFSTKAPLVAKDTNTLRDVYLRDLLFSSTTLISADSLGNATGGQSETISANGEAIGFVVPGTLTPRVFYRSTSQFRTPAPSSPDTSPLTRCSVVSFDATGRNAAVQCDHIYPGSGDDYISQGFCVDLFTNVSRMFSRSAAGAEANNAAQSVHMADDGRGIAMTSTASNLIPGDANGKSDAFVANCQ